MLPFKSRPGAVEPLSLVALVLLVVTLAIGTAVTSNPKQSFEIRREGSVLQATSGCSLDRFGECGGTCGGGTCGWQGSICGCIYPTPTPIPRPTATPVPTSIPTQTPTCDPDAWSAWSTCSAGCGGGTQSRTNQCGTRQTQSCNTQSCSLPSPTPTPVPASYTCTTNGGYCSPEGCGSDTCGSGTCAAGKSCCKACPLPTPTSAPSGGGTQPTPAPTATPNTCSYTCTSSGICSAEGGTAIVSQVCSSGSTCCNFQTQQPSSPQPTPTPAWTAPSGTGLYPTPRPTAVPGSTTTAPTAPPAPSSSGQCFWGASTCSAFGRYSGSGCTNCPSGVASCCGIVIPATADACRNSVGQHVDTRCVSPTRVAVCKSDKSGYNTQDCAGGWSCNASTGRCAPPPTPTPALNFNVSSALTLKTWNLFVSGANSYCYQVDIYKGKTGSYTKDECDKAKNSAIATAGISLPTTAAPQNSFIPTNNPMAIENSQAPSWGDVAQYYGQQAMAGFYQLGQTASTSQGSANLVNSTAQGLVDYGTTLASQGACAGTLGALGLYHPETCQNLTLAERAALGVNVASLGTFQQATTSFNQYGETNALANQYGLATSDPRRIVPAIQAGAAVTGFTAAITSPFINPETLAGKPVSSTFNSIQDSVLSDFRTNPITFDNGPSLTYAEEALSGTDFAEDALLSVRKKVDVSVTTGSKITIDPNRDKVLKETLQDAREWIAQRRTSAGISRTELAQQYVTDLFPEYNGLNSTPELVLRRKADVFQAGRGQASLGQLIECGAAVCREQSILLHTVLADVGKESEVVYGIVDDIYSNSGQGAHAWVEFTDSVTGVRMVSDPSQGFTLPLQAAYKKLGVVKVFSKTVLVSP